LRNPAALSLPLLFAGAAIAQAPVISKVELQQCGVYESKVERREDDAQSASGKRTIVQDNRLVTETSRIPARIGVKFGCHVVLQGSPAGELATFRAVLRLPAGAPKAQLSGSQSYAIGESGYVGYTFRRPDSVVRGEWMLQIWVEERKLAEKAFVVAD
jgi:Domain of unknown function (DUF3859)